MDKTYYLCMLCNGSPFHPSAYLYVRMLEVLEVSSFTDPPQVSFCLASTVHHVLPFVRMLCRVLFICIWQRAVTP